MEFAASENDPNDAARSWQDISDVIGIIVNSSGLARRDVGAVRSTCKAWRSSCDGSLVALCPSYPDEHVLDAVLARWPNITDLSLERLPYSWVCNPALSRSIGAALLMWLNKLQRLVVSCSAAVAMCRARDAAALACGATMHEQVASRLPGLLSLELHGPMWLRPAKLHPFNFASFIAELVPVSQLTSLDLVRLHLDGGWPTEGTDPLPRLQSLRLRECNPCHGLYNSTPWPAGVNTDNVKLVNEQLVRLVGLTQLQLSNCHLAQLPASISCLRSLRSLDVSHNQLKVLDPNLSTLTALELFDASHNYLSGVANLATLLSSWGRLSELRLRNVSDKNGMLVLPHKLPSSLQTLLLGNNHALDVAGALLALASCPKLRRLELTARGAGGREQEWDAVAVAVTELLPVLRQLDMQGVLSKQEVAPVE